MVKHDDIFLRSRRFQVLPYGYMNYDVDTEAAKTTTSSTFVDIGGKDISITNSLTCPFRFGLSFSVTKTSGGNTTAAFRISRIVGGSAVESSLAQQSLITNNNDIENGSVDWISSELEADTHTFRIEWRVVSGSGTLQLLRLQFGGFPLQGIV